MGLLPSEYEVIRSMSNKDCVFCEPHPALMLHTTEHFSVTLDVAPLVEGHLILHSKSHWGCSGEVPAELFDELLALKELVRDRLATAYGPVSFYEHGRAGHCLNDGPEHRLCHHFHLHAVPVTGNVSHVLRQQLRETDVASYRNMPDLYDRFGVYLYYEDPDGQKYFYPASTEIPRHFLRSVVSEHIGHPDRANWREYTNLAFVNSARERLGAHEWEPVATLADRLHIEG